MESLLKDRQITSKPDVEDGNKFNINQWQWGQFVTCMTNWRLINHSLGAPSYFVEAFRFKFDDFQTR